MAAFPLSWIRLRSGRPLERPVPEHSSSIGQCQPVLDSKGRLTTCSGIQAHIYVPEFGRQRAQGYPIWQRTNSWDDASHVSFYCLCCHSGEPSSIWSNALRRNSIVGRFALRCLLRQFFPGQILSRIRRDSTLQYSTFSTTSRNWRR